METLAYLYVIEEQIGAGVVESFDQEGSFLMVQDFQEDERCELIDAEVDALEQSVVWMMP
jgi:hypothetical protein